MESHNSIARTYTAPTCTLIVSGDGQQQSNQQSENNAGDFTLHLDQPDRGELDRITLVGKNQQLERLQQIVSKYISELVAKFPLPTANNNIQSAPAQPPQISPEQTLIDHDLYLHRDIESPRSGLMNNLPGLRNSLPQSTPLSNPTPQPSRAAKSSISNLFLSRWHKYQNHQKPNSENTADVNLPGGAAAKSASEQVPAAPYLTGSERSLDHQLHLGTLATTTSGEVLTLSAIQLFDLSTVLDEYVTETVAPINQAQPNMLDRASILGAGRNKSLDNAAAALPRLPNLPQLPAGAEPAEIYYRNRRSRSSFMSGIPWAIAAAIAVGAPLLLLDPNPNPLKDVATKLKMPGLAGAKKSAPAQLPGDLATKPGNPNGVTNPGLPTPWQTQPVQPPANNQPLGTGVKAPQNPSKIGTAPLPDSIIGKSGQDLPVTDGSNGGTVKQGVGSSILPSSGSKIGVAPNPLKTDGLPADMNSSRNPTGLAPNNPRKTISKPVPSKNLPSNATQIGQLPIESITPGKISVSKRPMLIPSESTPAIGNSIQQKPFPPADLGESSQKTPVNQKIKPAVASKPNPKTVKPTGMRVAPQPTFEPFTPVPRNPNLINPEQPSNSTDGAEPQNPPIIPNQPLQSNAGGDAGANSADNPSLQEAKRYFQSKWKANSTQPNSLQYVLQVNGKSGVVKSVAPQGEAATTYLQQTKLIKPGQKLISPTTAGSSDQKIRVLLEPDGNVDTFVEP